MDERSLFSTPSTESKRSNSRVSTPPGADEALDLWFHERTFYLQGLHLVAGVDEAGRGPLAGPVVAACIMLPQDFVIAGINDSKQLTAKQRETAYERLVTGVQTFGIGIVEPAVIDRINILRATHLAMRNAVEALPFVPQALLIDGLPVPLLAPCIHRPIVSGDSLSVSIAAASIIAKVTRDRLMCDYAKTYPEYGFEQHKGYGSAQHLTALRLHGPCPLHRRSFSPLSSLDEPRLL